MRKRKASAVCHSDWMERRRRIAADHMQNQQKQELESRWCRQESSSFLVRNKGTTLIIIIIKTHEDGREKVGAESRFRSSTRITLPTVIV